MNWGCKSQMYKEFSEKIGFSILGLFYYQFKRILATFGFGDNRLDIGQKLTLTESLDTPMGYT